MVQNTKGFGNFFKKMPLRRPVASQPHTLWGLYEVQNNLPVSSFMHHFWSLRFDSWLQSYRGKDVCPPCFLRLNNTGFIWRVLHCLFLTDNEFHSLLSIPGYLKVPSPNPRTQLPVMIQKSLFLSWKILKTCKILNSEYIPLYSVLDMIHIQIKECQEW